MKRIGTKSGKKEQFWANFRGCTGTGPTCTGTGQHNATCTGTGPRCTGIGVPKMPRMLCFCIIKPEFVHR